MIELWFDGSITYNPCGQMGFGVIIKINNKVAFQFTDTEPPHQDNSNNAAEFIAVIAGLNWLIENGFKDEKVVVLGDSQIVLNSMRKKKVSKGRCKPQSEIAVRKSKEFSKIEFIWIPREQNIADEISR